MVQLVVVLALWRARPLVSRHLDDDLSAESRDEAAAVVLALSRAPPLSGLVLVARAVSANEVY